MENSSRFKKGLKRFGRQKELQFFVLIGLVLLALFNYVPMFGIIMAFKDYSINSGIAGIFTSEWNNFAHFQEFFGARNFGQILGNTLALSFMKLIFTFPAPIILAVALNELSSKGFRRVVQTVSYLPNFISWVVVLNLARLFFSSNIGMVNQVLMGWGWISEPLEWLSDPSAFYGFSTFWAVWKNTGWWAIIYLAAITSIDPTLYEAASIDSAGRLQKIRYITLPGLKGTIVTVLILSLGGLLGGGMGGGNFEQSYLFGNDVNRATSEIIQTYAFRMGLAQGRFAYATAVDLVQSIISLILILSTNKLSKVCFDQGLF